MTIKTWGFRFVVVEHRPLVHIWVCREDGCDELLASPEAFRIQLEQATDVVTSICDAEKFYEHLIASGQFTNLDDVDEECRAKFGTLEFVTPPASRIHD